MDYDYEEFPYTYMYTKPAVMNTYTYPKVVSLGAFKEIKHLLLQMGLKRLKRFIRFLNFSIKAIVAL